MGNPDDFSSLILREYAFVTPTDLDGLAPYLRVCRVAGLDPVPDGYGLLLAVDEQGGRVALATTDVEFVRALATARPQALVDLQVPAKVAGAVFLLREGWPDDWV